MRLEPLGERAYLVRNLGAPAHAYAALLNASPPPGLEEAVASYDTVGLYVDPDAFNPADLPEPEGVPGVGRRHLIPVCYAMGEDLEEVARMVGCSSADVVRMHTAQPYLCHAIGFCPGFPYLGYVHGPLAQTRRRDSPRTRVPAGSVAVAGSQTGIYPLETPGGWRLIGRTPLTIVAPQDDYFPISPGDEVQFCSIDAAEFARLVGQRL